MDDRPSRILAASLPEPLLADPVHEEHGLACRLSTRPAMRRAHRHDDVELALAVAAGSSTSTPAAGSRSPTARSSWRGAPCRTG
jgi:hypothetical protein